MKNANSFITHELVNKNEYLSRALLQAKNIITTLEQENSRLKDVLISLASLNNEDLKLSSESNSEHLCSI